MKVKKYYPWRWKAAWEASWLEQRLVSNRSVLFWVSSVLDGGGVYAAVTRLGRVMRLYADDLTVSWPLRMRTTEASLKRHVINPAHSKAVLTLQWKREPSRAVPRSGKAPYVGRKNAIKALIVWTLYFLLYFGVLMWFMSSLYITIIAIGFWVKSPIIQFTQIYNIIQILFSRFKNLNYNNLANSALQLIFKYNRIFYGFMGYKVYLINFINSFITYYF